MQMQVSIIQANLYWEDKQANLRNLEEHIDAIDATDLVVLPEMFSTGFSMRAQVLAEEMDGTTINWMKQKAKEANAAICGSLIIKENGNYYNRFVFVHPTGELQHYDKRHLFSLAKEQEHFTAGNSRTIVYYKGWRILLQVCYDLRFPVFARYQNDYDLMLYVANWPNKRSTAWNSLLKARAIENMATCIGVNRVGTDKNDILYTGHSAAYDALGEKIASTNGGNEEVVSVKLNLNAQNQIRQLFNFLNDRDQYTLLDEG